MSGPPQVSAPLLAHWQGQAAREHSRPPLQLWLQQVQCSVPQSESRVQRCPTSARQRPWKHALLHESGCGVPSARMPAQSPPGGAYRQMHSRPQYRVVHCGSPQVHLSRHSASDVQGSPSSDLQTPPRHARFTPHDVPSATLPFAVQTDTAVRHEMIPILHGWLSSWQEAPAAHATQAPEASQTRSAPHGAPTSRFAPVSSHAGAAPVQWARPKWQGLLGRQSMFSLQTRFQISRVPPINESAVAAPAQNRIVDVDCEPPE
jgi:hypothetical protein